MKCYWIKVLNFANNNHDFFFVINLYLFEFKEKIHLYRLFLQIMFSLEGTLEQIELCYFMAKFRI